MCKKSKIKQNKIFRCIMVIRIWMEIIWKDKNVTMQKHLIILKQALFFMQKIYFDFGVNVTWICFHEIHPNKKLNLKENPKIKPN